MMSEIPASHSDATIDCTDSPAFSFHDHGAGMLLAIHELTKRFGGLRALDSLSLELASGKILGVIGPNGAGKTVLVNIITGFYRADSGSLRFLGREIKSLSQYRVARLGIARTFQNIRLFRNMTVLENVLVADQRHARRPLRSIGGILRKRSNCIHALELLSQFRIADKADQPSASLSYGDARRLEIVRALATSPKLLLLDEPAAGMNDREIEDLIEDIRKARAQVSSIILIEHNTRVVRDLCDQVIAMESGRKVTEGSYREVFEHPSVIDSYLGKSNNGI